VLCLRLVRRQNCARSQSGAAESSSMLILTCGLCQAGIRKPENVCTLHVVYISLVRLMRKCLSGSLFKSKAECSTPQQSHHSFEHTPSSCNRMTKFYEDTEPIALRSALQSDPPRRGHSSVSIDGASGWKYRRFFGLPHYASPQTQLVLVAFVCFLCPGM
jgi:hypothetical protein